MENNDERTKIDALLAEAEVSGDPIPAELVFAALKERAAAKLKLIEW